jgi:hypothetical protein
MSSLIFAARLFAANRGVIDLGLHARQHGSSANPRWQAAELEAPPHARPFGGGGRRAGQGAEGEHVAAPPTEAAGEDEQPKVCQLDSMLAQAPHSSALTNTFLIVWS